MQVVEGVVLQASVPACVVLTFVWLHGAVSAFYIIPLWSVYILSMLYYYTNACADQLSFNNIPGIYKPRLSAVRHVSVVPFLKPIVLVFGIMYILDYTQLDTLFVPGDLDQWIACIHLPLVVNCAAQETSRLLSFFYNMGKLFVVQLNIPNLWWLLAGLLYLCVHAYVLICVVDLLYAYMMSTATTFGFDNYYTNVDMNLSMYQWRINSKSDSSANRTMAGTEIHYWRRSCDRTDVITYEHDVAIEVGEYTYNMNNNNRKRYQRYVGEDINISCSYQYIVQQDEIGVYHTQFWKHNGRRLVPDKRHREGIGRRYEYRSYFIQMYLTIRHITESDFGNYSCIDQFASIGNLSFTNTNGIEIDCKGQFVAIRRQENGMIQVEKLPVLEHVIYVPVGNVIGTTRSFNYHTLLPEDLPWSVEYTVNGKPIDVVCPSVSVFSPCSFPSAVFLMFQYRISVSDFTFLYITHHPAFENTVVNTVHMQLCVCSNAYGWHKLSIFREISSDTQRSKVVEFDHPLRFLVLPAPSISLLPFWNDAGLYGDIAEEMKSMHSERDIHTTTLKLIKAHEDTKLWLTSIYHLAILLSLIYLFRFIMRWSFVKYCKLVTTPAICWHIRTKNKAIHCLNNENACDNEKELPRNYDAYISHCEHDYDWVTTKLVPHLEDICNIRVCLPDRDLRHGRNELHEMSDHMDASSKLIVVLSPAYLADYRCNQLQLHDMVLSSLYEKKRGPREILLFGLRPCTVVRPIRWNLEVDRMNWSSRRNVREQLHDISNWVSRK